MMEIAIDSMFDAGLWAIALNQLASRHVKSTWP
jgi:hypothetical protein